MSKSRFVGSMLGLMVGDAFGAPYEGLDAKHPLPCRYTAGRHMGLPHSIPPRTAMYTDDAESMLALAEALLSESGRVVPQTIARCAAAAYDREPLRGYPGSAQAIMQAVREGADAHTTGTLAFAEGSFANGGAMKITPVGLVHANATADELRGLVTRAILHSHVHPEAIEGAYVVARTLGVLLHTDSPASLDRVALLRTLHSECREEETKKRLGVLMRRLENAAGASAGLPWDALPRTLGFQPEGAHRFAPNSSHMQIHAAEAVACALWGFLGHHESPMDALCAVVGLGGDTDTLGAIVGAFAGALHGDAWIRTCFLWDVENGPFGRDYCIAQAERLWALANQSCDDRVYVHGIGDTALRWLTDLQATPTHSFAEDSDTGASTLTVHAHGPTDLWNKTFYTPEHNAQNAHIYALPSPATHFRMQVTISLTPVHQFDQGGLAVYAHRGCWIKCGLEHVDGVSRRSCVVTDHDRSDWSLHPSPSPSVHQLTLRLYRFGTSFVYELLDPETHEWDFVRVCHLDLESSSAPLMVGVFAACPKTSGASIVFSDFSIVHKSAHDHQL